MLAELAPQTLLEQSLASEITGASWRLRRCSAAEAELAGYTLPGCSGTDPLLDEDDGTQAKLRIIERARASAHSLLHRSINQLRKLQSNRPGPIGFEFSTPKSQKPKPPLCRAPLVREFEDQTSRPCRQPIRRRHGRNHSLLRHRSRTRKQNLGTIRRSHPTHAPAHSRQNTETAELGSNCKTAPRIARNAPCPCGSGEKYKRCCGKSAPPVLCRAA